MPRARSNTVALVSCVVVFGLAGPVVAGGRSDAATAAAPPAAGDDLPVEVPGELSEGNWAGTGTAWGVTGRTEEGVPFIFAGDYTAPVQLTVDDQTADGEFELTGDWFLTGGTAEAQLSGVYSGGGTGTVTGDRRQLDLDVTFESGGSMKVTAGGFTRTVSADHPTQSAHIDAVVTASTCSEAYLDWDSSWNIQLEGVGWQPTFDGEFVLVLDVEELRAAVDKWLEGTRSGIALDPIDPLTRPPGLPGVVLAVEGVLRDFRVWTQTSPMNSWDATADLVHDAEVVLNRLRNASPCDRFLVGDAAAEQFITLVTGVIARGIDELLFEQQKIFEQLSSQFEDGSAETDGSFAQNLMTLVNIAVRTGVIGSGAVDQVQATSIDELLRRHAERILTPWFDPSDSTLWNNKDTRGVLAIGAFMKWKFVVRGVSIDAATWVAAYSSADDFSLPAADG